MKITFFISALSGGGAERVVCNLANFLAKNEHTVEILTVGEAPAAESLIPGIKEIPLLFEKERKNSVFNTVIRVFRLARYMIKEKTDAYVVLLPTPTILMLSLAFLTKAPIIISERADPKLYNRKTRKRLQNLIKRASGAIFQTEEAKSWYNSSLNGVTSKVIPNAINPTFIRRKYEGIREKVIVGAGRLAPQKNFPLLISSFAKIADKFPEYKLAIYGKGKLLESLQKLAEEKGVGDRVEFPGYVSDMPERLEKASMFVLSSDYEGMPNALMEAMALGLPVVSTDCGGGGAKFLIQNEENGLLVPQNDEVAMSEAMEKILSDENFAKKISENARKLQEILAPDKIYGEWEKFILNIVGEK